MAKSAKEIKKSLTDLGLKPEAIEATVAAAIADGTAVDDLTAPAVNEEIFNKALATLDQVLKPGEHAINKSQTEALERQVEEALAAKDGPSVATVINIVKSHAARVDERLVQTDELVRTFVRAIKDVFISTVDGVNTIAKSQTAEFNSMKEAIHNFGKSQVKPQARAPGQVAPAQGAAGSAAAQEVNKSQNQQPAMTVAQAKVKIHEIIKSETKNPATPHTRREQLALAVNNLHGCNDLNTVIKIGKLIGVDFNA